MKDFWVTLIAPLLVALIAGYILRDYQVIDRSDISAEMSWLEASNTFSSGGLKSAAQHNTDLNFESGALDELSSLVDYYNVLRVAELKITNNSDRVSRKIEVQLPDGGIFIQAIDRGPRRDFRRRVSVDALNPGATLNLTVILKPSVISEPNVLITHDGVKVDILSNITPDYLRWPILIIERYPAVFFLLAPFLVVMTIILVIVLPFALVAERNIDFKARITSKAEIKKMKNLLAYGNEKYPDKFSPE